MGGWLLGSNVRSLPFSHSFCCKWEKVGHHPWLNICIDLSTLLCSFVWRNFFAEASVSFLYCVTWQDLNYQCSHLCIALSLALFLSKHFLVPRCCLHLACLHVTKPTGKHSVKWKKASGPWIFLPQGVYGGRGGGFRVHPITDSNGVKYSLANRETRQWNGGVQSCSEPAGYPAKCANQKLVCLINTNGQQIALLGNLWRLEGCIKGQGRGDR